MKRRDKYFFDKLNYYYDRWREKQKREGHRGSQSEFARLIEDLKRQEPDKTDEYAIYGECRYQNVSQWLNGTYPNEYVYFICKALGIEEADLYPRTNDEKWVHDVEYMNRIQREQIEPYTDKIGLDVEFLRGLRSLVDFESEFPLWTGINKKDHPYTATPEESIGEYGIDPESILSDSAPMDDGVFQIERTVDGKDRLITVGRVDLVYLRWVQREVKRYVRFLFSERRQNLLDEVTRANEINKRENIRRGPNGKVISIVERDLDIRRVDEFVKEVYRIEEDQE